MKNDDVLTRVIVVLFLVDSLFSLSMNCVDFTKICMDWRLFTDVAFLVHMSHPTRPKGFIQRTGRFQANDGLSVLVFE